MLNITEVVIIVVAAIENMFQINLRNAAEMTFIGRKKGPFRSGHVHRTSVFIIDSQRYKIWTDRRVISIVAAFRFESEDR